MIGLRNLTDGGHVLEHPAGPLYVTIRRQSIVRAELAPWGDPTISTWKSRHRLPAGFDPIADYLATSWGGDAAAQV